MPVIGRSSRLSGGDGRSQVSLWGWDTAKLPKSLREDDPGP